MASMREEDMDEDQRQEMGRFLRGTPDGVRDDGGTELYEDRQERNEREEMKEDMPDLSPAERGVTPVARGRPAPPVAGTGLTGAFSKEEDDRQMGVVGNTDMSGFKTELRRRLGEARGREGRIMKKMSKMKPGQARRRLRKGMRSMMMGFPDKPDSISAFDDINEVMQPVTDVLPPLPPPPPVDFDDPNIPLTDEEDRR